MTENISPNTLGAATEHTSVSNLDQQIAEKMTAMREQTLRNQILATNNTETGQDDSADDSSPVAPDAVPEVADDSDDIFEDANRETDSQETVTSDSNDSTSDELIDFIEFAETNQIGRAHV